VSRAFSRSKVPCARPGKYSVVLSATIKKMKYAPLRPSPPYDIQFRAVENQPLQAPMPSTNMATFGDRHLFAALARLTSPNPT
jgi:hypothetical protein